MGKKGVKTIFEGLNILYKENFWKNELVKLHISYDHNFFVKLTQVILILFYFNAKERGKHIQRINILRDC